MYIHKSLFHRVNNLLNISDIYNMPSRVNKWIWTIPNFLIRSLESCIKKSLCEDNYYLRPCRYICLVTVRLLSNFFLMKCLPICMCCILSCLIGLWAMLIAKLLSQKNFMEPSYLTLRSSRLIFLHNSSHSLKLSFCTRLSNYIMLAPPCY